MEDLPVFDPASFSRARRRSPDADPELLFGGGASAWRPWGHVAEVRNDTSNVFLRALYKRLLAERERRAKRRAATPASIVSSIKRTRLDLGPDTPPSGPAGLQPRRLVDDKKKEGKE